MHVMPVCADVQVMPPTVTDCPYFSTLALGCLTVSPAQIGDPGPVTPTSNANPQSRSQSLGRGYDGVNLARSQRAPASAPETIMQWMLPVGLRKLISCASAVPHAMTLAHANPITNFHIAPSIPIAYPGNSSERLLAIRITPYPVRRCAVTRCG